MRSLLHGIVALGVMTSSVYANGGSSSAARTKWSLHKFENLITFGDRLDTLDPVISNI